MQLTHEHKELYRTAKKFVEEEINPYVKEWEEAGIFPAHEVMKKLGALGLLGITKPVEYGGLGLDYHTLAILSDEFEYIDSAARVVISVHNGLHSCALLQ